MRKFLKYEDIFVDVDHQAEEEKRRKKEKEEEEKLAKLKANELLDFDPESTMGRMQKLFNWDRKQ